MTRQEIRKYMVESIATRLNERLGDLDKLDITEEEVQEFLWNRDYGSNIVEDIFNEKRADYIQSALEIIYDDICEEDIVYEIEAPF